jgi:hypothetical protein
MGQTESTEQLQSQAGEFAFVKELLKNDEPISLQLSRLHIDWQRAWERLCEARGGCTVKEYKTFRDFEKWQRDEFFKFKTLGESSVFNCPALPLPRPWQGREGQGKQVTFPPFFSHVGSK